MIFSKCFPDSPVEESGHSEELKDEVDRPTVGTATHGDGQAPAWHHAPPHHEVNSRQDDVGQHSDSQHPHQDKTVDGVDLHTGGSRTSLKLVILFTSGSKVIDIEAA